MAKSLTSDEKEVVRLIKDKIAELDNPELQRHDNPRFIRWRAEVEAILRNSFPVNSPHLRHFISTCHYDRGYSYFESSDTREAKYQARYQAMLPNLPEILNAIVFEIENFGIPSLGVQSAAVTVPSRYKLSSPVYWVERLWHSKPASAIVGWVKTNRLLSGIISTAIATIIAMLILALLGII